METHPLLVDTRYKPGRFLNYLLHHFKLANDSTLARRLKISHVVISKLRNKRLMLSASLLIHIHQEFDLDIEFIRDLIGDYRSSFHDRGML